VGVLHVQHKAQRTQHEALRLCGLLLHLLIALQGGSGRGREWARE
jgi:hypothetical protein